jgi:hypothetical protein
VRQRVLGRHARRPDLDRDRLAAVAQRRNEGLPNPGRRWRRQDIQAGFDAGEGAFEHGMDLLGLAMDGGVVLRQFGREPDQLRRQDRGGGGQAGADDCQRCQQGGQAPQAETGKATDERRDDQAGDGRQRDRLQDVAAGVEQGKDTGDVDDRRQGRAHAIGYGGHGKLLVD